MKSAVLSLLFALPILIGADEFSVKKFGAKGDGKTDDTAAIQAAVTAAHKRTRVFRKMGNQPPSSAFGTGQTVTFPPGVYKVTKTIRFSGYVSVAGTDGSAMIQWHGEDHGTIFDIRSFRFGIVSDPRPKVVIFVTGVDILVDFGLFLVLESSLLSFLSPFVTFLPFE